MAKKTSVTIEFNGKTDDLLNALRQVSGGLDDTAGKALATEQALKVLQETANAFGNVVRGSVQSFAEVEQALTQTSVLTGTAKGGMSKLGDEVLRLAQATSKTPKEIAAMTTELGRAGFTADQQVKALSGIVSASEATGEALQTVGKISGTTLQVFGMLPEESQKVADVLTQVANASMTSVTGLGEALRYVGGTAKQNNQSLEDTTIAIGLLADRGIDASVAGTNLRQALTKLSVASAGADSEFNNLVKGGGKAVEAFKAIGATARNADGTMRPLLDIIPDMKAKMEQLSEGDRQILTQALFGTEGGNAMLALLGTTTERIQEMRKGVDEAVASQRSLGDSKAMMDNLNGSFEQLGGSVETVSVQYGMFLEQGVRPMIDNATKLVNVFGQLPPVYQQILFASTTFAGILVTATAAIAAYNIAKTTQVALEIKAAAATVASALSLKGLAFSAATAADATLAFTASIAPLLMKMALVVGAAEALRQAYNSVATDGGANFRESTNNLRKALLELEQQTKGTAKAVTEDLKPAKRSWTDFFGFQATRQVNQAKIAVRDFRQTVGDTIMAAKNLGNSQADNAKKAELFQKAQEGITAQIAALDEKQLGTEAYKELRAELDVSQKELDKWRGALKIGTQEANKNAQSVTGGKEAIAEQTKAIDDQITALEKLNETRKKKDSQAFEDAGVKIQRKNEDDIRARADANQKAANARQEAFQKKLEAEKEEFDARQQLARDKYDADKLKKKQAQEDGDRQSQKLFDEKIKAEQKAFEVSRKAEEKAFQEAQKKEQKDFDKQQQAEQKTFSEKQKSEDKKFGRSQQSDAEIFNKSIEAEKNAAAKARQESEKALAAQISARLEQQAQAFGVASTTVERQVQLLSAGSDVERAALEKQFAEFDRIQTEVQNLDLANKIFSPDEIIQTAQNIANVGQVKTAEQAKQVQEVIGQIEAEQKRQQTEADKAAQEQLRAQNEAAAIALEDSLNAKKEEFRLKQEAAQEAFRAAQEVKQQEFQKRLEDERTIREEQRQLAQEARQTALDAQKAAFDAQLDAQKAQRETELIALRRQREAEDQAAQKIFDTQQQAARKIFEDQTKAEQKAFEAQQQALQAKFNDSERIKQQAFEDTQRERQRLFSEKQRQLDEASAAKIAALKATAPSPTTVTPRFAGGEVRPGQLYLGGEINPEPIVFGNGKMAMVGMNGAELFRVNQPGMVYPSVQAMGATNSGSDLLAQVVGLRQDLAMQRGSNTYNIVGAADPVRATIKLQQEQLKQMARRGRF